MGLSIAESVHQAVNTAAVLAPFVVVTIHAICQSIECVALIVVVIFIIAAIAIVVVIVVVHDSIN